MKDTKDVVKKFQEINEKNYIVNLIYDVDNNKDSFILSVNTYLNIYKGKVIKKISSFYNENNIEYTISDLTNIVNDNFEYITSSIDIETKKKYNNIKDCINDSKTALKSLIKFIESSTEEYKNNIQDSLNDVILIKLKEALDSKFKLHNENQLEEFIGVLDSFNTDICLKINDSISHRDETLKIIAKDTYETFKNINNTTNSTIY